MTDAASPVRLTNRWVFAGITPAVVAQVREIVTEVAKRHKLPRRDAHVRKGTGSMKHAVMINVVCDPAIRIEICEALLRAGFESVMAPYGENMDIAGHCIRLAREWAHRDVRVSVAPLMERPA